MKILYTRIEKLINIISSGVYEKESIFRLAMLALLSGESVFLLGKPGIAKSLIGRRIKFVFKDGKNFEYLMNRFSTPEEIFGPVSIKDLLDGKYLRLTTGYLPTSDVAFLDEIWKAGPSIQNTLLTIINEKIFRNDNNDIPVPIKLVISASNELPESGKGLEALFDRFIIRIIVSSLNNGRNFNNMLQRKTDLDVSVSEELQITESEYQSWLEDANKVLLSADTLKFISIFRTELDEKTNGQAYISDRRWKKIAHLVKVSAFFEGRARTNMLDLLIIPYCIWDNEDQEAIYTKIFQNCFLQNLSHKYDQKISEVIAEIDNLQNFLDNANKLQEVKLNPSIYVDPFNQSILGEYHRVIWDNSQEQIAFLSKNDYQKIISKNNKIFKAKLYYGTSLNQMTQSNFFYLQSNGGNELQDQQRKKTYYIEMQDIDNKSIDTLAIEEQIDNQQKKLQNLYQSKKQELTRFKRSKPLFFKEDWQLLSTFIQIEEDSEIENNTISLSDHPDFQNSDDSTISFDKTTQSES